MCLSEVSPIHVESLFQPTDPIPQGPKIFNVERQSPNILIEINGMPQSNLCHLSAAGDARIAGKVEHDYNIPRPNGPLKGIRTMVAPAPVDNLRCRVLRYDAESISTGFKNHAAIGNSGNEVPCHPDAAGLKRQRHREHVAAPRVDFHWWQGVLEMGRKSVFLDTRVPASARN